MSQYRFLEALEKRPELSSKLAISKSIGKQIVEEFLQSSLQFARIKADALTTYKNAQSAARGMGRIIKTIGQYGKIKVYSDKEYCFLEKVS